MGYTAAQTWVAGTVVTAADMNTYVRDNQLYFKGTGQVPTVSSGLVVDNTDGDEYFRLPALTTAQAGSALDTEANIVYDGTLKRLAYYSSGSVETVLVNDDVDDIPVDGASTVPVSSNWAYDFQQTLTASGDLPYATGAGVWGRLGLGTIGHVLSVASASGAPEWRAETARTNILKSHTRAMNAGNGDVAYTGYGFQPTSLIMTGAAPVNRNLSIGFADVNLSGFCVHSVSADGAFYSRTDTPLILVDTATGYQLAVLKTLDADGFTLTWTKTGTVITQSADIIVLALR